MCKVHGKQATFCIFVKINYLDIYSVSALFFALIEGFNSTKTVLLCSRKKCETKVRWKNVLLVICFTLQIRVAWVVSEAGKTLTVFSNFIQLR